MRTQTITGTIRTNMQEEAFYQGLDKGIRFPVRALHAAGIETCQSCEGGGEHAYDQPSIDIPTSSDDSRGFAALAALRDYGIDVRDVSLVWPVRNGLPSAKLWRITLRQTYPERADDLPGFVNGYVGQEAKP